jgi:hypothetical protein
MSWNAGAGLSVGSSRSGGAAGVFVFSSRELFFEPLTLQRSLLCHVAKSAYCIAIREALLVAQFV